MQDFVERVCTGFCEFMHTHVVSYLNRLNDKLVDAQLRGDYVGGYSLRFGEDRYSLPIHEAASDKEGCYRPSPKKEGGSIIEVLDRPSNPPYNTPEGFFQTPPFLLFFIFTSPVIPSISVCFLFGIISK